MIRFALALLGLSAGAGAAQDLVPLASGLEKCGLHVEMQAETANDATECTAAGHDEVADDERSEPEVPPIALNDVIVETRAVVQRSVLPTEPAGSKPTHNFFQTSATGIPDCVNHRMNGGLHPIETNVVFSVSMDGSDPSAMFCP